ncbi:hypothetical protein [Oceanicola sp. 22II-s10i]|uniref:hypothetical protein n=1 Tax=Oceanicola sp. 22II-s10i TaxID=1317116 RepID=UPI000B525932|nr:hypothetical protein [Oceanicola sp. 22II-s10i]
MFKRAVTAIGLALALSAPAYALNEPLPVSNVKVDTALEGVNAPDVLGIYPKINEDLTAAIWERMENPMSGSADGYDIDVRVTNMMLDDAPMGPDGQFNTLEGIVAYTKPLEAAPVHSVPVTIRATSGAVPPGVIAIAPSEGDFYAAMIGAFAKTVEDQMVNLRPLKAGEEYQK